MLTRREFIKKGGALIAGGIAAASGVLAIMPVKAAIPTPVLSPEKAEAFGHDVMDGIVKGIGPSWDKYDLIVYGKALMRTSVGFPPIVTSNYFDNTLIRTYGREELIAAGIDWDPKPGEICDLGIVLSRSLSWRKSPLVD